MNVIQQLTYVAAPRMSSESNNHKSDHSYTFDRSVVVLVMQVSSTFHIIGCSVSRKRQPTKRFAIVT